MNIHEVFETGKKDPVKAVKTVTSVETSTTTVYYNPDADAVWDGVRKVVVSTEHTSAELADGTVIDNITK